MYTEGGTNISYGLGYHNDHVDELIEEAATCLDAGRLTEIYTELQEISAVDFPNIPMCCTPRRWWPPPATSPAIRPRCTA